MREIGILIVGHGSERSPGPFASASGHAERLRDSGRFLEARVAFLMAGPDPSRTLASMHARTVHIVPLFMCDGYYTRTVIPKALGLQGHRTMRDGRLLVYGPPVGTQTALPIAVATGAPPAITRTAPTTHCPVTHGGLPEPLSPHPAIA